MTVLRSVLVALATLFAVNVVAVNAVFAQAPVITSLSPTHGDGGDSITVYGENLSSVTEVTIGGAPTDFELINDTSLTVATFMDGEGTVPIVLTNGDGSSLVTMESYFTYGPALSAPTITSFSPTSGGENDPTQVTVQGTNFVDRATEVWFGAAQGFIDWSSSSTTSLFVEAPMQAAGAVDVKVVTPGGSDTHPQKYTYGTPPTPLVITNVAPLVGSTVLATPVLIDGTGFVDGETTVTFGNAAGTGVMLLDGDTIYVMAPAQASGPVDIHVETPGGEVTYTEQFIYADAPVVTGISPAFGPLSDGTTEVTITGSGFNPGDNYAQINFGSFDPYPHEIASDGNSLKVYAPTSSTPGPVDVVVRTNAGASNTVNFTYLATPTATLLEPTSGYTTGNTLVTVTGSGFVQDDASVTIGSTTILPADVEVLSDTSLRFRTPARAAGPVNVSVTTSGGTSPSLIAGFAYIQAAVPTATSLSPAFVPKSGDTVTIAGDNFISGETIVLVGAVEVTPSIVDTNTLTFTAPSYAGGTVSVAVRTPGGTTADIPGGLTYVPAPAFGSMTPDSGPTAGGTTVAINGGGFYQGDLRISVDGQDIGLATVTATNSASFVTPQMSAGFKSVQLTTAGGSISAGDFNYIGGAEIDSVSPAAGGIAGGNVVTITGSNFYGQTSVSFGGEPATNVVVNSPTSISATVPAATSAGAVYVIVTTPDGPELLPNAYTYLGVPVITAIEPAAVPLAGASITITGSGFAQNLTTVTVDGEVVTPSFVSSNTIMLTAPANASAGPVDVTVSTDGGSDTADLTYRVAPTASSLTPITGPGTGGTVVTVTGTDFVPDRTQVHIGGTTLPYGMVNVDPSGNSLTFTTPIHAGGNADVWVITDGGNSAPIPDGFTFTATPTATSLSPTSGPTTGGTLVTITGSNFVEDETTVGIAGNVISAGSVTVISPTELTFLTPVNAAGNAGVSVTTPIGTSLAVPTGFTYVEPPTATSLAPAYLPTSGGSVTINGTGFIDGQTEILFGGSQLTPSAVGATSVTFTAPVNSAGSVDIAVRTPYGTSANIPGGLTYLFLPGFSGMSPTSGPTAGGTTVTINGSGFYQGDLRIAVDGQDIGFATVTSTSLASFVTPQMSAGAKSVQLTTAGGTRSAGNFTYVGGAQITSASPNMGPLAGGNEITITGSNFYGQTSVSFGDQLGTDVVIGSPTSLTVKVPAGTAEGLVDVTVTTPDGPVTLTDGYDYLGVPVIDTIDPAVVPMAGGVTVTLSGSAFVPGYTTLKVDGQFTATNSVLPDTISFTAPVNVFGEAVEVEVTTDGGSDTATLTYVAAPTAAYFDVAAGPTGGGTLVNVTGTDFVDGQTSVTIGGSVVPATFISNTSISFATPPHAAGVVPVSVTTPGGTTADIPGGFTYYNAPTATTLIPASGPIAGGTLVTVSGSNFEPGTTSVSIGGTTLGAAFVTVNSPNSLTFTTPAQTAGTVDVTVSTPGGTTAPIADGFIYAAIPVASSLSPDSGPIAGGTIATLTGSGFIPGGTSVTIGGTTIPVGSVNYNSDTSITFTTPAHAAGNVAVTVQTAGGSSAAVPGGFTYDTSPSATSLSPSSGPMGGGTVVTITGSNFVALSTTVSIGGITVPAESVIVESATSLNFVTPPQVAGTAAVTVTNASGTSSPVPGGFTYLGPPTVSAISPDSGPTAGGTFVTLTGSGFIQGGTEITIGGNTIPAASVTFGSSTSVSFTTPLNSPGAVAVSVSTIGGNSAAVPGGFTYIGPNAPTVTGVSPNSDGSNGGALIVITGTNFTTTTQVHFGTASVASFVIDTPTQITVAAPAGAAGIVDVRVTNPDGQSAISADSKFTYLELPGVTDLSPDSGPASGGTPVTIIGSGFTGATAVEFGGVAGGSFSVVDDSTITVQSPPGMGSVNVVVKHPVEDAFAGTFAYLAVTAPQDSFDVAQLQQTYAPIVARNSASVIDSAINRGISVALSSGAEVDVALESAFFAYAAEPSAALAGIVEAANIVPDDERWSIWLDTTGSGLVDLALGNESQGWQVNITGGVGYKVAPDVVIGVIAGYETFAYRSTAPAGTLEGEGYSVGAYFGAGSTSDVLVDLSVVWTGLGYDAEAGAANGSFDAGRWLVSGGLAGAYELGEGLTIVPSARLFALWEEQGSWTDSLGTVHDARDFGMVRASGGLELSRALPIADGWSIVPSIGLWLDYQLSYDTASPGTDQDGFTGRAGTGLDIVAPGGARLGVDGEIRGLGTDTLTWSLRGTAGSQF